MNLFDTQFLRKNRQISQGDVINLQKFILFNNKEHLENISLIAHTIISYTQSGDRNCTVN